MKTIPALTGIVVSALAGGALGLGASMVILFLLNLLPTDNLLLLILIVLVLGVIA
jgi:hypothetical protein